MWAGFRQIQQPSLALGERCLLIFVAQQTTCLAMATCSLPFLLAKEVMGSVADVVADDGCSASGARERRTQPIGATGKLAPGTMQCEGARRSRQPSPAPTGWPKMNQHTESKVAYTILFDVEKAL